MAFIILFLFDFTFVLKVLLPYGFYATGKALLTIYICGSEIPSVLRAVDRYGLLTSGQS